MAPAPPEVEGKLGALGVVGGITGELGALRVPGYGEAPDAAG